MGSSILKMRLWPGLLSGSHWGAYSAPADLLANGRGFPVPSPFFKELQRCCRLSASILISALWVSATHASESMSV